MSHPGVSWPHDVQRIITRLPSKCITRLVSADAAEQLPEPRHRARTPARLRCLAGPHCRQLLRIVRDHGSNPLSVRAVAFWFGRQPFLVRSRSTSRSRYQEVCHGSAVSLTCVYGLTEQLRCADGVEVLRSAPSLRYHVGNTCTRLPAEPKSRRSCASLSRTRRAEHRHGDFRLSRSRRDFGSGFSRKIAQQAADHEADVRRPLAEAAHEVGEPLPAERARRPASRSPAPRAAPAGRAGRRRASGTRSDPGRCSRSRANARGRVEHRRIVRRDRRVGPLGQQHAA